jgi:hypothetical protein
MVTATVMKSIFEQTLNFFFIISFSCIMAALPTARTKRKAAASFCPWFAWSRLGSKV